MLSVFLQEWGKHTCAAAQGTRITVEDVNEASDQACAALDRNFFRVRFDRLTPREQDDLHAMAQLGYGLKTPELGLMHKALGDIPLRSGDTAHQLFSTPQNALLSLRKAAALLGDQA